MLLRTVIAVVVLDLYAYMHEVEGYQFAPVVLCVVALSIADIILEKVFK